MAILWGLKVGKNNKTFNNKYYESLSLLICIKHRVVMWTGNEQTREDHELITQASVEIHQGD